MLGRERREERREERHEGPAPTPGEPAPAAGGPAPAVGGGSNRYKMTEKLASIGDDFWIENEAGQRIFKVDGKALRVRDTLKLKDMQGNVVAEIQEKVARVKDTMDIARNGQTIATVKKALVTPIRGRFSVNVAGGADMDVDGNVLGHEFKVDPGRTRNCRNLTEVVSRARFLRSGDSSRAGRCFAAGDHGRD